MLIDITRTLGLDDVRWPGDPPFRARPALSIANGDGVDLTLLEMVNHAGTHLDAPSHFFEGAATLNDFPLERFHPLALVAEIDSARERIEAGDIDALPFEPGEAVLFKTRNGRLPRDRFREDYVALSPEAAERLAARGAGLVGVDYLSIDPCGDGLDAAHRILLAAGTLILEDADLRAVVAGRYRLRCFPLKLHMANGAPCRATLETL
ncbi:MAG: Kynurenine formamidase [candidate division BRC1 bacterium ADurb.BinA364]|nr:MAG: Kynurenine formamidase [candidate division BRC1 bacterium ADurb.BinA364]